MQQFGADSGTGFVTATMAAAGCSMQFVLPNRTPLPATREARFSTNRQFTHRPWISIGKSVLFTDRRRGQTATIDFRASHASRASATFL